MKAKDLITECEEKLGKMYAQTCAWILRYWDKHAETQKSLVEDNVTVGWDPVAKANSGILAYVKPESAGVEQVEQLVSDAVRLNSVNDLMTSPMSAAKLLVNRGQDGRVRCRYFTRVGHARMVVCTCEGRAQRTRGYIVLLRGNRNPSRAPLCDKCLGKMSRDHNYMESCLPARREQRTVSKPIEKVRTAPDYWTHTVVELRELCRNQDLPVSGTKSEVISRLQAVE